MRQNNRRLTINLDSQQYNDDNCVLIFEFIANKWNYITVCYSFFLINIYACVSCFELCYFFTKPVHSLVAINCDISSFFSKISDLSEADLQQRNDNCVLIFEFIANKLSSITI